ncbi:2-amino-4-hydroxy-6-hydroxymethyldihydropteridine pyrophosphokinase [Thalassoglobus neptunius]|uniref:2-amino-4-hydroxy-6-hydroxymethyldihydropteridine pyrophosphokinase n=1 Tax=Thalassoglobus neptunius TaxID=1938619 RepID=A0A5C5X4A5_9PLAN|nr:2-amino-4-hydroxy-6-hydroxymethyldihydropteridine diphosphokinase [Thalassoglobus neptunius]TWT57063.1 2-amino-4-hydroxy-6-hydroxymethyldihydropteridine pyrophosphokinase [Thalassoglobus neptunius]
MSDLPDGPSTHRVFVTLGSNINPQKNLPAAVQQLSEFVNLLRVSSVWISSPVGFLDQPEFANAAVLVETNLSPRDFKFQVLREIESNLGRVRDPSNKNGPRTIDLDIAFFGNSVICEEGLVIPDQEISELPFLSRPLCELDPEFVHPQLNIRLRDLDEQVAGQGDLKRSDSIDLLDGGNSSLVKRNEK